MEKIDSRNSEKDCKIDKYKDLLKLKSTKIGRQDDMEKIK